MALLGKQVWRVLHHTDSLQYKVFKSKYFTNCSILDDEVKTNGSYAWQSILKAKQVVRLGARWRIGNGESVIVRKDKWLPTQHVSCIITPQINFPNNTRVSALIDEENSCWLEDRIRSEFLPYEAKVILSLPLNHGGAADKLIWSATKNGVYTTKSAYQLTLLMAEVGKAEAGPSNRDAHKSFCQQLWSLNAPSKIRHFIWRGRNDSLPTKQNLIRRVSIPNALS